MRNGPRGAESVRATISSVQTPQQTFLAMWGGLNALLQMSHSCGATVASRFSGVMIGSVPSKPAS
jgi:hypothetical protein